MTALRDMLALIDLETDIDLKLALRKGSWPRGKPRPLPTDFAEQAARLGGKKLIAHYGSSWATISRWYSEAGITPRGLTRPVPDDFADNAATMTERRLIKHYRTNARVVQRWCRETGIRPLRGVRLDKLPVPVDFAASCATMTCVGLSRHYRAHHHTVARWLRESGLTPIAHVPKARAAKPRVVAVRSYAGPKSAFTSRLPSLDTLEAQAANHLRRECAVYRCTERGAADQQGTHWRYGNAVLTPDEMVARAVRHGFDPQAWERLAA